MEQSSQLPFQQTATVEFKGQNRLAERTSVGKTGPLFHRKAIRSVLFPHRQAASLVALLQKTGRKVPFHRPFAVTTEEFSAGQQAAAACAPSGIEDAERPVQSSVPFHELFSPLFSSSSFTVYSASSCCWGRAVSFCSASSRPRLLYRRIFRLLSTIKATLSCRPTMTSSFLARVTAV